MILSSQTPQKTPPDTDLLIRGKRLSSTHQNAGTSPSHQEAYTRHWTNPTSGSRKQKREELQPCSLGKGDLKYCKLDKMRRQRNILQAKEQDKNSQDQINEEEIGASLVAQWLRVCLPMQGTRVPALVWEDPTCRGATRPVSHNY